MDTGILRMCGSRSLGWWCILLAALLAMATYVLFEEMDVLGSRLASRLAGEAVAALEYTALDAERLSQLHLSVEQPSSLHPSFVTAFVAINAFRTAELTTTEFSLTTLRSVRARAKLSLQVLPATTSPVDPF